MYENGRHQRRREEVVDAGGEEEADCPKEDVVRLPQGRGQRIALSLALVALSPLATGVITACVWAAMESFSGLTYGRFMVPYLTGAVLGGAGSAAATLILPIRYWLRIALAVACPFAVFFGFPLFVGPAAALLHYVFGIGPEVSLY